MTGSRTWVDTATIRGALYELFDPEGVLVSGGARGADALCEDCWGHWGGQVERHPADWATHGRRAGIVRNSEMIKMGADVCLAFIRDFSPGASHAVKAAERAGIPVRIFRA